MTRSVRLFCGALVLVLVAGVTAGCQVAKAGAKCHTTALAHDASYVLQCTNGHWRRTIPTSQAIANVLGVLNKMKAAQTTTTAPAPATEAPAATAGTTTTTVAPTTTTTAPATTTTSSTTTTTTLPATTTTTTTIPLPPAPKTTLVSLDGTAPAATDVAVVGVSDDGRYVVYDEQSSSGIANGWKRDLKTGTVTKVTVQNNGTDFAAGGTAISMSSNGRYVAFLTAGNLEVRDTTGNSTVQVGPTATTTTMIINAVMSADGSSLAYLGNAGGTNGAYSVFQSKRQNGTPVVVSVPPTGTLTGVGNALAMSSDGRYVVFSSAPDPTTGANHLYRRDLTKNTTVEVGLSSTGVAPDGLTGGSLLGDDGVSISADGNTIAFDSDATNLVTGDTNGITDIFVRNVSAATTVRASVGTGNVEEVGPFGSIAPVLSADGNTLFFTSFASNLVSSPQPIDVYMHNMTTGATTSASIAADGTTVGNGPAQGVQISSNARYVLFSSEATNLVTTPAASGTYYEAYLNDRGA